MAEVTVRTLFLRQRAWGLTVVFFFLVNLIRHLKEGKNMTLTMRIQVEIMNMMMMMFDGNNDGGNDYFNYDNEDDIS